MPQRFEASQWIPYTVDLAFAFFANPHNLPLLMPESMKMCIDRVELAPAPANPGISNMHLAQPALVAGTGTRIEISFRPVGHFPVRATWEARITEFVWFSHFCDEQVKGPFEHFRHRHSFRPEIRQGQMGTELRDEIEFSLPLGRVGHVWDRAVLRQMGRMFKVRQQRLPEILEEKLR